MLVGGGRERERKRGRGEVEVEWWSVVGRGGGLMVVEVGCAGKQ